MDDRDRDVSVQGGRQGGEFETRSVSRREFLKLAGAAGATIGLGAGLGGALAACGGGATTTTSAAASSSTTATTAASTTTSATAGTTTSAGPTAGREIKIGFVSPLTGGLATFGTADKYCVQRWQEVVGDGWVCGDGQKHPITFLLRDSQSATDRAAQVAGDLINNDKIDIMMVASTPDTVNPVAEQAEANAIPCYSNDAPWQPFFYRNPNVDPAVGYKWTYHHFWGLEDVINVYTSLWKRIDTNKVVGAMWPNDADGNAFSDAKTGFPSVLPGMGYTLIDPGRYQNGSEDFTTQISQFKNAGVEILTGVPIPPDFTNLWKQCLQQGFKPKIATIAKAVDLPAGYMALGSGANNFTLETQWTPRMQFTSSLTGETCQQIADGFEKSANEQWAQYLLHYAVFEVVADSLKRTSDIESKEAIIGAISTTKLNTIAGPVDFTSPVKMGTPHPVKNVYRSPLVAGQWQQSTKWPRDLVVVDNTNAPEIAVDAEPLPLV